MKTLIARQPIFRADDALAGYGLLCRTPDGGTADPADDTVANDLLVRALTGIGLDRLSDGLPAFIGVTRDVLLGGTIETLDPAVIVIRLLESVDDDVEILDACRHLAALGYTLALDRYTHTVRNEALIPSCRIIGLDVARYDDVELTMQVALLRPYAFKVLRLLRDPDSADHVIEDEFRRDPALSFRLLRIVNSAAVGGSGVRSIQHAIRLLGRDALQRWLSLLLIPGEADTGAEREKLKQSLTRARFCELLAESGRRPVSPGTLFLVGILSSLESFYGLSMESIVSRLDLAPEIGAALIGRCGVFGAALGLVCAHQVGDWDEVLVRCEDLGIEDDSLTPLYLDALAWAQERLDDMAGEARPAAQSVAG